MRFTLMLLGLLLNVACSGGDSATDVVTSPPVAQPPTSNEPASLQNSFVNCGTWSQSLPTYRPPYSLKNHQHWVIIGSSSAFGAGASSYSLSWAGQITAFATSAGIRVTNIAKGGTATYQGLSSLCTVSATRLQPDSTINIEHALKLNPDLVIISYPSNDAALSYGANESAYNLLLMRELLARERVATVIIGAQPRNMAPARQQLLLQLEALLTGRLSSCFVSVYQQLADVSGNLSASFDSGDGVHLNDAGHQLVSKQLMAVLTDPSFNCVM